jgi:cytoskeletal protein RodZ
MDEELAQTDVPTVGERLRAAREEKKLNLEDIAAQTRIPQRHLEAIEAADWEKLPAPTYTVGFAKSYASAVGLDRTEIGEQLREEMGGQRFFTSSSPEVFEPADPARTMPKWLVIGAAVAVILLVVGMSWLNHRALNEPDQTAASPTAAAAPAPAPAPAQAPPSATPAPVPVPAQGGVVLTATAPAWIQVTDQGNTLFSGELQAGQAYAVPATATAPLLKAGKPEALVIKVGSATAPQIGPAGEVAANVSLKPADLMRGGMRPAASPPTAASTPAAAPPRPAARRAAKPAPPAAPAPVAAPPTANVATNAGE